MAIGKILIPFAPLLFYWISLMIYLNKLVWFLISKPARMHRFPKNRSTRLEAGALWKGGSREECEKNC